MHLKRIMAAAAAAALTVLLIGGCNQSRNMDGHYKGVASGFFGLSQFEATLEVSGKSAIVDVPSAQVRLQFQLRGDGDRFAIYEHAADDGLTFNITNKGNTLVCNQCEGVGFPTHWERQIQ